MIQDQQNYYWLFSSSAQSISAFIALLITGFALVLNVMDNLQQQDDTLVEIHDRLKKTYYRNICILSIVTGLAIIFSLWMVYLNGGSWEHKKCFYIFTVIFNLAAIVGGILFVLSIINPNRYRKAAKEIIEEDTKEFTSTGNDVDQLTFMTEFINLEKKIRKILQDKSLYISSGTSGYSGYSGFSGKEGSLQMKYSFRQMINALFQSELITRSQLEDLLQINKYRNLIFHGHQDTVDKGMLDRVKSAEKIIDGIK